MMSVVFIALSIINYRLNLFIFFILASKINFFIGTSKILNVFFISEITIRTSLHNTYLAFKSVSYKELERKVLYPGHTLGLFLLTLLTLESHTEVLQLRNYSQVILHCKHISSLLRKLQATRWQQIEVSHHPR